jgi:hypothetical protein
LRKLAEKFRCPKFTAIEGTLMVGWDQPTDQSTTPSHWRGTRRKSRRDTFAPSSSIAERARENFPEVQAYRYRRDE